MKISVLRNSNQDAYGSSSASRRSAMAATELIQRYSAKSLGMVGSKERAPKTKMLTLPLALLSLQDNLPSNPVIYQFKPCRYEALWLFIIFCLWDLLLADIGSGKKKN